MINQWLTRLNFILLGVALLLGLGGVVFWLKQSKEIVYDECLSKECKLPKNSFELKEENYDQIGGPLFALEQTPATMQLPDLKSHLIYYGRNGRPDAQSNHTLLHFSINGNKTAVSTPPDEPLYLIYDRQTTPGRYNFSPQNEKTSLWFTGTPVDNEVQIQVTLENEKGEKIVKPAHFASFRMPEKEFSRHAGVNWEIGGFRVDGTLLARQKTRWFGCDRFLEHHGGADFEASEGKQRIDFGENDDLYSVFMKAGDCLIWDQKQWKSVNPGEESLTHPLLVLKKIDERLMTFELWDVEGKGKVLLNVLKSTEPWPMQNSQSLQHIFKFVGARTKTQCVFEINQERIILRPSDWLLMTSKGWKKLSTEEDIDDYVKRKSVGTLFVFEGITRKGEKQLMLGKLYSPARNEFQEIEIALQKKEAKTSKEKELKDGKENSEVNQKKVPVTRENEVVRHPMVPTSKTPTQK